MKKKSSKKLNKSKSKDKKDKSSDKKSKSSKSKSKKSSRSNSKEKISSKGTEKNIEESINPDVSGINKEPGQNNNLDLTYTQYFSNRNQLNNNININNNNVILSSGAQNVMVVLKMIPYVFAKNVKNIFVKYVTTKFILYQ